MTFLQLYGTKLDRELGTTDRTQRFTTALRKEYVGEGHEKFNEHTSCYTKRSSLALVDETQEYDLENAATFAAEDFLWPAKVGASIKRTVTASGNVSYLEGDDFQFTTEEELNETQPNWRAASPGTPTHWYFRMDGATVAVGLYPAPDIPATETWVLFWPYVAKAPALSADADIPYAGRITLVPYHDAILAYAAAQCEKLRKNWEGVDRQMKIFGAFVVKFTADQQPKRGTQIRLAQDYRRRLRTSRPVDPLRA